MSVEQKKSKRKKTSLEVLADVIIYLQSHREEIPKQRKAAIRWAASKFPAANERAIAMAFEKVGVKFAAKSRSNGRSGVRGLASKSDIKELWTAISQLNQIVFFLGREIETQIGAEKDSLQTIQIQELLNSLYLLRQDFEDRCTSNSEKEK